MFQKQRKILIIGAGHVGTICGLSLMQRGEVDELVYIDIDKEKEFGQALDLSDAVSFLPSPITVRGGSYTDAADADIIVIAAGKPRLPGQTRLDMFADSLLIADEIISHLKTVTIPGILITISNPADIVADYFRRHLQLPWQRCFSTGTSLDSGRLRRLLSERTEIDRESIQALVMGEHGDSQMIPFSAITIGPIPFDAWCALHPSLCDTCSKEQITKETADAGMKVVISKGSTEFGIGIALSEIVSSIFHDTKKILPVSPCLHGEYGYHDLHIGVPCVIGKNGVEEILVLQLTPEEQEAFDHSVSVINGYLEKTR